MSSVSVESSETKSPGPRKRVPGPFHAFAVIGLATFLLGLAMWGSPSTLHTVGAKILLEVPGGAGTVDGPLAPVQQITADPMLRDVAHAAGLLQATSGSGSSPGELQTAVDRLREQIVVRTSKGSRGDQMHVQIQYPNSDQQIAFKLVDRLTHRFVEHVAAEAKKQNLAVEHQRLWANTKLTEAQQGLNEAKVTLNKYVDDRLRQLEKAEEDTHQRTHADEPPAAGPDASAEQNSAPTSTDSKGTDSQTPASDGVTRPNDSEQPEAGLEPRPSLDPLATVDRLRQLLESAPDIIRAQTNQTTAQPTEGLSEAPEKTEADVPNGPGAASPVKKTRLELLVELRSSADYHDQYEDFTAARTRYEESLLQARQADQTVPPPSARIVEQARVLRRSGDQSSGAGVVILGLFAALVAWRVNSLGRRAIRSTTFTSIKEVAESLQLTVLGAITTNDGPAILPPRPPRLRLLRIATRTSELTITVAVVLLIFVAIANRPFVGYFVDNPFSAYTYALHWVAERLVS